MSSRFLTVGRSLAGTVLLAVTSTAGVLGTASPASAANPSCPSGSDGSTTLTYSSISIAKSCFRWSDKLAIVGDINPDGISAYNAYVYFNNGWVGGQLWDANGADNGWEYSPALPANRNYGAGIRACGYDRDGSSGRFDYGCTAQVTVYPSARA